METIKLGPRLDAVASFIPLGARVADVGTDHGYLPIWLRMLGISPRVIASDIRRGPLLNAKSNAEKYHTDGIDFRLCPGLRGIRQDEADAVVIAGMSGETILSILDETDWDWQNKTLILEANTKHPELLTWLYEHGFHVDQEACPRERGRVYRVYSVIPGHAVMPRPAYLWGGFIDNPYARRQAELLRKALKGLEHAADETDQLRRQDYQRILEDMNDAYHWRDPEKPD